nr:glycerophosphodiester phosphodiesterase family protein [Cellulomonas sp. APG4]
MADGADGLECDVRLTADDVAVCWHDATLDRTTTEQGPLAERTYAGLREVLLKPAGTRRADAGGTHRVLRLAELVELAAGAARTVELAVEVKHPDPRGRPTEDAALEVLTAAGWEATTGAVGAARVSLMAFDPDALERLAGQGVSRRDLVLLVDAGDPVALTRLTARPDDDATRAARSVARALALVDDGAFGGVGPSVAFVRGHPERVERWVRAGRALRVWTVAGANDLDVCLRAGAEAVITDQPAALRRILGRAPGRGGG